MMNNSQIYNKKLHISGLIMKKNLQLDKRKKKESANMNLKSLNLQHRQQYNSYKRLSRNLESRQSQHNQKERINQTINRMNKMFKKANQEQQYEQKPCQKQIQLDSYSEKSIQMQLLSNTQNDYKTKNSQVKNNKPKYRYSAIIQNRNNPQYLHRSIESSTNLSTLQSVSRCRKISQKTSKHSSSLTNKYKQVTLLSREPSICKSNSAKSLTKLIQILNLYPKKSNDIKKGRKTTAMNKYSFESENIRLAQKLLNIKPSRPCDKKEQFKFFKKQQYFRQLRSCSVDFSDCLNSQSRIQLVSQSVVSLPKINQRYHTIEC